MTVNMTIETLLESLTQIEQAAPGTAAKSPRAQLLKTISFLNEHRGRTIDQLVADLQAQKPPPKVPKVGKGSESPKAKKPKLPVQMDVVEQHIANLKISEASLNDFADALAALQADKKVRIDELKEIARGYSGDASVIKTKAIALGVIQRAFDSAWNLRQHKEGLGARN